MNFQKMYSISSQKRAKLLSKKSDKEFRNERICHIQPKVNINIDNEKNCHVYQYCGNNEDDNKANFSKKTIVTLEQISELAKMKIPS